MFVLKSSAFEMVVGVVGVVVQVLLQTIIDATLRLSCTIAATSVYLTTTHYPILHISIKILLLSA